MPTGALAQVPCSGAYLLEDGWGAYRASALEEAARVFGRVLDSCPDHVGARIGLAYVQLREGKLKESRDNLEAALSTSPENTDALKALARLEAREGAIETALAGWHRVLQQHPQDVEALVGLAQTLRWAGRPAEAAPYLTRAEAVASDPSVVAEERAWQRAATRLATTVSMTWESDSDDNRILTTQARAALPLPRGIRLEWQSYLRSTSFGEDRDRLAVSHKLSTRYTHGSGWTVFGELGGSQTSILGQSVGTDVSLRLASPSGKRLQGSLGYLRAPRHYTSTMIERGVRTSEMVAALSWREPAWEARVDGVFGTYRGTERNGRWEAQARVDRVLSQRLRVGGHVRSFGFERDVRDGYFDPGSFIMTELPIEYRWEPTRWALTASVAPGVQRTDRASAWSFAPRSSVSLQRDLAPGRSIRLAGSWARSDAARLSDRSGRYRYASIGVAGSWVF